MKCIDKKQPRSRQKEVQRQLLLIGLLLIFLLAGILGLLFISKSRTLKEFEPYNKSIRTFGTSAQENTQVADGIANHLCVGAGNTPLAGIDAQEGELAGLFDISKKEIPFSQNMYERVSPGRITQLMTALVAYEKLHMDASVTVEPEDRVRGKGVKHCGLSAGDVVSVQQLIQAVLVYSAEDACMILARTAGKDVDNFVAKMNDEAQQLGMTNTNFVNVTGYSDENQYTTVYDIYLLLNRLLEYPDLIHAMELRSQVLDYSRENGTQKQKLLDSDNLYVTQRVSVPKGVTVLGGKSSVTGSSNDTVLLVQNNYGNAFVAIILQADNQGSMYERMDQMLKQINP